MSVEIPSFEDALTMAEDKLSRSMVGECIITVHRGLDDELKQIIMEIDQEKFREELQYDDAEIDERSNTKGFLLLLLSLDRRPVGFDCGYDDAEPGAFFSDSSATLIERKGWAAPFSPSRSSTATGWAARPANWSRRSETSRGGP